MGVMNPVEYATSNPHMHGVARISFEGGARLMPARNRYDQELVFEEAEFCARRHGKAILELNRHAMSIRAASAGLPEACAKCARLASVLFALGGDTLCRRCARKFAR
jgi:hypothetical protein